MTEVCMKRVCTVSACLTHTSKADLFAVCTTVDDAIVVCGSSRTNRLAERPNGCGLVVLDVEEAVHLGDLEQVVDPLAEVHHL